MTLRVVALGDSITLGMGDPMPDGSWRGWSALLAESLAAPGEVEFHNLASSGARARDVAAEQMPRALEHRPHVATVVVGINDTLRHDFDPAEVAAALARTAAGLRGAGAIVLTISLPDPGRMFGLPRHLAAPLGRRIRAVNAAAEAVAERFGCLHWNAARHATTYDRPMWSVDRLHPSECGHRLLATSCYDLVAAAGGPVWRRPSAEPQNPPPTRSAGVWWMLTKGTTWFLRRSVDLIPYLLWMAFREWIVSTHGSTRRARARPVATDHAHQELEHPSRGIGAGGVRHDPGVVHGQRHRGRAALAQGLRAGLGDQRVFDAAPRDDHPVRAGEHQGAGGRPYP
jgi:lysophospholipase L1-like esterase